MTSTQQSCAGGPESSVNDRTARGSLCHGATNLGAGAEPDPRLIMRISIAGATTHVEVWQANRLQTGPPLQQYHGSSCTFSCGSPCPWAYTSYHSQGIQPVHPMPLRREDARVWCKGAVDQFTSDYRLINQFASDYRLTDRFYAGPAIIIQSRSNPHRPECN